MMKSHICRIVVLLLVTALLTSASVAEGLPWAAPEEQGFSTDRLARIRELTQSYVDEGKLAGVVTMVRSARQGGPL